MWEGLKTKAHQWDGYLSTFFKGFAILYFIIHYSHFVQTNINFSDHQFIL